MGDHLEDLSKIWVGHFVTDIFDDTECRRHLNLRFEMPSNSETILLNGRCKHFTQVALLQLRSPMASSNATTYCNLPVRPFVYVGPVRWYRLCGPANQTALDVVLLFKCRRNLIAHAIVGGRFSFLVFGRRVCPMGQ